MGRGGGAVKHAMLLAVVTCAIGCHRDAAHPSGGSDDLVIRRHAPPIGAHAHVETIHMRKGVVLLRTADSPAVRSITIDVYEKSARNEVVLAADAFHPTRLQVEYIEKTHRDRDADGEHVSSAPVVGKRYVVEPRDGKLVVSHDGAPANDEETAAVVDDYKVMLDPDVFPPDAFAKPITIGKESPPVELALSTLLHVSNEDVVVAPARAVLLGTDGEGVDKSAVFQVDVALAHVLPGGLPIRETLQLTGEWRLAIDGGWPSRVVVQGPTAYSSAAPDQLACEGEGEIQLDLRRTYAGPSKAK
jgi:hypothetical protein